jgi:cytochrome c biogenesis protein
MVLIATIVAVLFNLHWIYSSWSFLAAITLLLLNTLACTITRIQKLLNRASKEREGLSRRDFDELKNHAEIEVQKSAREVVASVKAAMDKRGYRAEPVGGDKSSLYGQKGKIGDWGSIVFHLSFLVIVIGAVYSVNTRHVEDMVITEGQIVTMASQKINGFQVKLNDFRPTYDENMVGIDYAADLVVFDDGQQVAQKTVRVNSPLAYKGANFLLTRYGFAPRFVLSDDEGEIFNSFVNLMVLSTNDEDSFVIPGTELEVKVRFYPDVITVDDQLATESMLPDNPVVSLNISDGDNQVFNGAVAFEQSVDFGDQTLSFGGLRYWTQYQVTKDAGKEIIFGGFWLSVIGLILRYSFIKKQLWVKVEAGDGTTKIVIDGRANQFDALYEGEFSKIVNLIERENQYGAS